MGMDAIRSIPYCEVDFHTASKLYSINSLDTQFDPSNDIIRVNTTKSLSSTAGNFTIELVYKEHWYKDIDSMDVVVIKMGRLGDGGLKTVMIGLVDEVRKTTTLSGDGKPTRAIRIMGRDFGKVFLKCMVEFFPEIDDQPTREALRLFFIPNNLYHGKPSDLVYNIMTQVLPKFMNFSMRFWDKVTNIMTTMSILDVIRFQLGSGDVLVPISDPLDSFEGSVWNFMTYGQNAPFTELFIDSRPTYLDMIQQQKVQKSSYGVMVTDPVTQKTRKTLEGLKFGEDNCKVILMMRPTPFDADDWKNLKTNAFDDIDIVGEDLGRSDHQQYNVFFAVPRLYTPYAQTSDQDLRMIVKPPFNKPNMLKYGISVLKVECAGLTYSPDDNFFKATGKMSKQLSDWYGDNHKFEEGTRQVYGRGDVKVGEKAYFSGDNMEYYIEGVNQDWVNTGDKPYWYTSMQMTRGKAKATAAKKAAVQVTKDTIATPTVKAQPKASPRYHTVQSGDTMWSLAVRYYGNGNKWRKIYEANKDIVKLNDSGTVAYIYPGQKLVIPE